MRTVYAQKNKKIILGRQGEDKAVRVVWPGIVSDWSSLYGDGSFQLSVRRFGDENAYPVVVEANGDDIRFTVTSAETAIAGNGKCELTYIANGTIAKSATWETVVLNSLTGQTPSEPPEEPAKSWFTAIQGQIGNLDNLETASKGNLVAAINETAQSGGGGGASVALDTTLTQPGKAADAKAVGDALAEKQPKGDYLTQNELPDMTAYRTAEAQDVIDAGKQDTLIQSGAHVGQVAKITAVDDTGKPTAWEAVDMPSGGGIDWQLVDSKTLPAENSVSELEWTGLACDNLYFSATIGYGANITCTGVYVNGVLTFKNWYQFQHASANMTNTVLISKMPERYRTEAKGSYEQKNIFERNWYVTYEGKIDSIKFVFENPFTKPISLSLYKG